MVKTKKGTTVIIVFDSCIVRGWRLDSPNIDVLRALKHAGIRVGVPWMVLEELAAHEALEYGEAHDAAAAALASLTPAGPHRGLSSNCPK